VCSEWLLLVFYLCIGDMFLVFEYVVCVVELFMLDIWFWLVVDYFMGLVFVYVCMRLFDVVCDWFVVIFDIVDVFGDGALWIVVFNNFVYVEYWVGEFEVSMCVVEEM